MDTAERIGRVWTADEFLRTDQAAFGDAWRYELVDGRIVAHAAPEPEHGAILAGLVGALGVRLRGTRGGSRPEIGSDAVPRRQQRNTARIPDAMIRCGDLPRVAFEVVSPSELRHWRARDRKRRDLQEVEDMREIVEIYQDEPAIHVYRKEAAGTWSFEAIGGADATLRLASVGLEIPLREIYKFATPPGEAEESG
jgi:Uma2 family endonuclease